MANLCVYLWDIFRTKTKATPALTRRRWSSQHSKSCWCRRICLEGWREVPDCCHTKYSYWRQAVSGGTAENITMMTSSNWNIFRVTGPLWRESLSPVDSPHKGQWCGALMLSLICTWTNVWVNNLDNGDLRRDRAHYGARQCNDLLYRYPWWRHDNDTLSTLLVLCEENAPMTGGFPSQKANNAELWYCMISMNKPLNKQSRLSMIWKANTLMWRHYDIPGMIRLCCERFYW